MAATVVIAGSSGFLGTALAHHLTTRGDTVRRLVRRGPRTPDEHIWDPSRCELDERALDDADAVVNLCGANAFTRPWTPARRAELLRSRVEPARCLAQVIARHAAQGHRPALLQASAIGYYGTSTDAPPAARAHAEDDPPGTDFLADLCRSWEEAAGPAEAAGIRVCHLRSAVVLSAAGGTYPLLRLPYLSGLGPVLGTGDQHFAVIGLRDWLAAVSWLIDHPQAHGPYNLVLPTSPTNAEFGRALTARLHRPQWLRVPLGIVRAVHQVPAVGPAVGPLADQLFGDQHAVPKRLTDQGFGFTDPDIDQVLAAVDQH